MAYYSLHPAYRLAHNTAIFRVTPPPPTHTQQNKTGALSLSLFLTQHTLNSKHNFFLMGLILQRFYKRVLVSVFGEAQSEGPQFKP